MQLGVWACLNTVDAGSSLSHAEELTVCTVDSRDRPSLGPRQQGGDYSMVSRAQKHTNKSKSDNHTHYTPLARCWRETGN